MAETTSFAAGRATTPLDGDQELGESADGGDYFLHGDQDTDTVDGDNGIDECKDGEVVLNCEDV